MNRPTLGLGVAIFCAAALGGTVIAAAAPANAHDDGKELRSEPVALGYLENASLGNRSLVMKAKLDTGADTSSVYARDVRVYKRGKKDNWVTFRLIGKGGRSIRYDQNVIRFVQIKAKRGGAIRRPVIRLPLCVGGVAAPAEFNLADRAEFDFDILVGREFLAHRIIVDSSRTYTADQSCGASDDK